MPFGKPLEELNREELDQLGKDLGVKITSADVWEPILWTPEQYGPLALRVRNGNEKLTEVLKKIWKMIDDGAEQKDISLSFDRLTAAVDRLKFLCLKLEVFGPQPPDCLYIVQGKKTRRCDQPDGTFCYVCPSKREYWMEEKMQLFKE